MGWGSDRTHVDACFCGSLGFRQVTDTAARSRLVFAGRGRSVTQSSRRCRAWLDPWNAGLGCGARPGKWVRLTGERRTIKSALWPLWGIGPWERVKAAFSLSSAIPRQTINPRTRQVSRARVLVALS
jgi:hypothetical protein